MKLAGVLGLGLARAGSVFGSAAAAASTLLDGLVSYWTLDEQSGTRVDSVGSNDLTDNNTVLASNRGPTGTVASLVAANDEYLTTTGLLDPLTGDISMFGWVKYADISNSVWTWSQDDGGGNRCFSLSKGTNGVMTLYLFDSVSGNVTAVAPSALVSGAWAFIGWTYNSSTKKAKVWVNGVAGTESDALSNGPKVTANYPLGINAYYDDTMLAGATGVWNVVINPTTIFNSGNGKHYADLTTAEKVGLVSYWNLDEVSGTRADSHGSNDLTDNNTVGSETNAGAAMDGAAASFVAANQEYLSNTSFSTAAEYTFAFWFYSTDLGAYHALATLMPTGGSYANSEFIIQSQTVLDLYTGANGSLLGVSPTEDAWHLLVLSHKKAAKQISLFLDNVEADNSPKTYTNAIDNGQVLTIGAYAYNPGTYGWTGLIDEVGYWSRVLTSDERTALYNAGAGRYYPFTGSPV
jgi:hypothetical protein